MKNMIDFVKIKNGELGTINFYNMIPITSKNYKLVKVKQEIGVSKYGSKYRYMLTYQLNLLNANVN